MLLVNGQFSKLQYRCTICYCNLGFDDALFNNNGMRPWKAACNLLTFSITFVFSVCFCPCMYFSDDIFHILLVLLCVPAAAVFAQMICYGIIIRCRLSSTCHYYLSLKGIAMLTCLVIEVILLVYCNNHWCFRL